MFFLVQKRPRQCFRGPLFLVLHQKTQHSFQHHPAFIFRDFSFPSLLYISSNILFLQTTFAHFTSDVVLFSSAHTEFFSYDHLSSENDLTQHAKIIFIEERRADFLHIQRAYITHAGVSHDYELAACFLHRVLAARHGAGIFRLVERPSWELSQHENLAVVGRERRRRRCSFARRLRRSG